MLAIITSHPIQYQAPLWRELARAGVKFEVWFLTPHAVQSSFDREFGQTFAWDVNLLEGYPHRFLPVKTGWRLDRFRGIRLDTSWAEEFRARGVTHVWVEGWRFLEFWRAVQAARAGGLQVWLRGESHDLAPEPFWRRLVKRPLLDWLFQRVDRFLCIGAANRRYYGRAGVPEAKLCAAPYGVDNDRFAKAAAAFRPRRAELRAHWSIAPDAYVVLFCGKLIAKKRPLDLVAAARLAPALAGRPVHLLFAGDGELVAALNQALAGRGGPAGTITGFLNQTQIPGAFAAADCLVLPSDYGETWGLVVNEALASGLPAIASDRCGCAEDLGLRQGRAHVFACGDVADLARSLRDVADRPPPPALLQLVVDAHDPRRTVETVQQLLGGAPNP